MQLVGVTPFKTANNSPAKVKPCTLSLNQPTRFASNKDNTSDESLENVTDKKGILIAPISIFFMASTIFCFVAKCFVHEHIKSESVSKALNSFQSALKKETQFNNNTNSKYSDASDSDFQSMIAALNNKLVVGNISELDPDLEILALPHNATPEQKKLFDELMEEAKKIKKTSQLEPLFDRYLNEVLMPCVKPDLLSIEALVIFGKPNQTEPVFDEDTIKRLTDKCRFDAYNYFKEMSHTENLDKVFMLGCIASLMAIGGMFAVGKKYNNQ